MFLLAVKSHVTPGMTSCNINYFRVRWWFSYHLPRLPDGAAQQHAEDHPKHLQRGRLFRVCVHWRELEQLNRPYQNNADGYSHSADDVELGVKDLIDGVGAALRHRRVILLSRT